MTPKLYNNVKGLPFCASHYIIRAFGLAGEKIFYLFCKYINETNYEKNIDPLYY